MLLSEEANAVEHGARALGRSFQPRLEAGVFCLELRHTLFGMFVATAPLGGDALQAGLSRVSTLPECREFLAKIADERFELAKCLRIRPCGR
jgi:hypothetical protein